MLIGRSDARTPVGGVLQTGAHAVAGAGGAARLSGALEREPALRLLEARGAGVEPFADRLRAGMVGEGGDPTALASAASSASALGAILIRG